VSHVFVNGVYVVDVGHLPASAVLGEVSCFSAVKARAFGALGSVVLLYRYFRHIVVFGLGEIGVCVVVLVLASVIGGPGVGQIHGYLHIVIGWARGVGGVVNGSLLLLLRSWLILRVSSPYMRPELVLALILPLIVVISSWVWQSSSGSDEFDHLSSFCDIDGSGFVFIVVLGKWNLNDFVENARGESIEEEPNGFLVANRVARLAY
jgi:hypothetical protein